MKYLFVLGRNPALSAAEIVSYCEKQGIEIASSALKFNAFLLETGKEITPQNAISALGGTLAIGRVLSSGSLETISGFLQDNEVYFGQKIKFIYSVLGFCGSGSLENLLSILKQKFKREKTKAHFKGIRGSIEMQSGRIAIGSPSKLKRADALFFLFKGAEHNFGIIESISDPKESEAKDMKKPVRRESLAISPRLAKILVNLSHAKKGETLLDPFCGIGVILQETLLQNINVIGIDIDSEAARGAEKNLQWLKKNYGFSADYKVLNQDSKKISLEKIDSIATEPTLSRLLRQAPSKQEAEKIIEDFTALMVAVLSNTKKFLKPNGKIAFTAPRIKTRQGTVSCDIKKICEKTGLRIFSLKNCPVPFPIIEARPDQIVEREIFILEK